MDDGKKRAIENSGSTLVGAACGPGAVIAVAGGATDAAAITTALAALGAGSMLIGVAVAATLGIGGFFACRWTIRKAFKW